MHPLGNHSEYGRLREVIVGSAQDLTLPPFSKDLGHYNDELRAALEGAGGEPLSIQAHFPERWEKTCEQIEGVVKTYQDNGVTVHRLRPYTAQEKTYLAGLQRGYSQLYPADPVFMLGDHFIELNIRRAYRRKEVFPIRDTVLPLLDKAHYVAMPHAVPATSGDGQGPFLEGGDILIVGNDVIVGSGSLCSNREGIDWLRRYVAPHGYNVHPLPIKGDILHALGVLCLLREGLAMAHLPALADGLPPPIANWDIIEVTEEEMWAHATVGVSLDDKRHLIDDRHRRVMDELDRRGIEPVPVACDAISFWGGTIRCVTLPLTRDPA